jgi:hypothetical protein
MHRTRLILRVALGGAVCGCFGGILLGAVLGALYGLAVGNVSLGLDGSLLGGAAGIALGALVGVILGPPEDEPAGLPPPVVLADGGPPNAREPNRPRPRRAAVAPDWPSSGAVQEPRPVGPEGRRLA